MLVLTRREDEALTLSRSKYINPNMNVRERKSVRLLKRKYRVGQLQCRS
jgi:hypothetical protein